MNDLPTFYDPQRIGTLFYPDMATISAAASTTTFNPVTDNDPTILLVIVDMQVDFCHPQGSLYINGAEGDIQRLIEFISRYADLSLIHI